MGSAAEDAGLAAADRLHLSFALGKALEDRGRYQESFTQYERGNALKRAGSRYRPELYEINTRLQKEVCTRELFAHHRGSGAAATDPIFIVGLPRAGSTLIEQILASHSAVEGTHELADMPRIVASLQGRDDPTDRPRYPGGAGTDGGRGFPQAGRKISQRDAHLPQRPGRASSTRCRTTSGTSV